MRQKNGLVIKSCSFKIKRIVCSSKICLNRLLPLKDGNKGKGWTLPSALPLVKNMLKKFKCSFCKKIFIDPFLYKHPKRIRKFCSRLCDSKSIVSEETCRKISKANKGRPSPVKGMKFGPHTEEWKKMMSERMKGVPRTEEIKKKISKSHLGIKPSVDTRKKMSERRKGRPHWNKGGVAPWFVGDKNPAWIGGESSYIIRE